jgi:transposase
MHSYPSSISREEFEIIRYDLENAKKRTKPRKVDLYDMFCAVLYVVKGGIQWRMLPSDFPKWTTVYFYFQIWSKPQESGFSILEKVLKKIGEPCAYARYTSRQNEFLHR